MRLSPFSQYICVTIPFEGWAIMSYCLWQVLATGTAEKPFTTVDSYGKILAAAGGDGWIRLLNVPSGQQRC